MDRKRFSLTFLAISIAVISSYVIILAQCHGHAHSHEAPSFKYSQSANKERPDKLDQRDSNSGHGHSHADASHGHSHGGASHEHIHGEASHGHTHGGAGHGHSHGGASHEHTHGEASHGHTHGAKHNSHAESHGTNKQGHTHVQPQYAKPEKNTGFKLWFEAITATALISIFPIFILLCIPLDKSEEHQPLLKILLSFASGGLLGDAFLHLIPHAVSPHSHEGNDHFHDHGEGGHSHDMSVGLWTLAGIVAFLMVEKFVRIVKGNHGHAHAHSHAVETENINKGDSDKKVGKKTTDKGDSDKEITDEKDDKIMKKEDSKKKTTDKKTDKILLKKDDEDIKVAGYLNLAADFAHNFTDGLAIGASFMMGHSLGIVTTITIFLHEIPHEIGDFAILVQSGCTKKKAMMLQFSTAIGAMMGTICSLLAEGIGEAATTWILPFTAGGFIYIATVSVIPELLEDTKLGQSVKEIAALLVGVYMMVLIGQYE